MKRNNTSVLGHSIPEIAESVGVSKPTIYKEIANGNLQTFKLGRRRLATPAAIEAWIKKLVARSA